jgi:hypothetical protein
VRVIEVSWNAGGRLNRRSFHEENGAVSIAPLGQGEDIRPEVAYLHAAI